MASTLRFTSAYAVKALLLLAMAAPSVYVDAQYNTPTPEGCYSSSTPLKDQGSYTFQSPGYCQKTCVNLNKAVFALEKGSNCWCGDEMPALSSKVSMSNCDSPCQGYDTDNCGGQGYWQVFLSGTTSNVAHTDQTGGSGSGSGSGSGDSTTASPSVVTSISPGKTVVITQTPDSGSSGSSGSGGTNTTAIAAGVVVGVVLATALAAGIFFFVRYKRRKAAEEDYNRSNQVADFMRGGNAGKPPATSWSSVSDSRLDPEAGAKRNSRGSIADDQDFSRRILRVANPDHS